MIFISDIFVYLIEIKRNKEKRKLIQNKILFILKDFIQIQKYRVRIK